MQMLHPLRFYCSQPISCHHELQQFSSKCTIPVQCLFLMRLQTFGRIREVVAPRPADVRIWTDMSRYTAVTDDDLKEMLATIGVGSIDELFAELVPEGVRLDRGLDLPDGLPEQDVYDRLRELAGKNVSA